MVLRLPSTQARQYTTSKQLIGGDDFNNLVAQLNSEADGLIAGIGGGQANATQINTASATIKTVTTGNDSAKLPKGIPGLDIFIQNADGANSLQVFTFGKGTINGTDGAVTGVAQAANANSATNYICMRVDAVLGDIWITK